MGQIVRRKRRGRPSNLDRALRSSQLSPQSPADRRSTRRRRNVRYNFDIDDYVDDNEFEDDDEDADIGRREKKLRLLLFENDSVSNRPVSHAPSSSSSSSSEDDEDYNRKPSKKRKLGRQDDEIEEIRRRKLEEDDENEEDEGEEEEEAGGSDFDCGTMSDLSKKVNMPDKKTLELILDKLQKKDIYGVYAEPVDPEELPDYHDVIKHPMDFATVRKKLAKGLYISLKDLESDVFLICTNAMQYNAPDTVYYKQASSIQEQAKLKFQRIRANTDSSEKELKPDHKTTPSFTLPKNQLKKSMVRIAPGPDPDLIETETFSGATVRLEEFPNGSSAQTPARPNSGEVMIAENSSLDDNNHDKDHEPLTGKGLISKLGRKPSVHDEDRRATYKSLEPVTDSDSVFSIFEGESKQFIPVGLHVDHSYARSLARFAATLGPVAWKIASHTIEQALPESVQFGPGWVGEYEPLPTPVLVPENRTLKEPNFLAHFKVTSDVKNNQKAFQAPKIHVDIKEANDGFNPGIPVKQESSREHRKDPTRNPSPSPSPSPRPSPRTSLFSVSNLVQQNISKNFTRPENMGLTQVELNHPPSLHQNVSSAADFVATRLIFNASDNPSKPVSRNGNLVSLGSFKHPNSNNDGFAPGLDFVAKRQISNASDIPSKPISRNGNLASLGSFKHPNSNNEGFAPGADVAKRPNTNAFDVPSKPVPRNEILASLGSFKHRDRNNDGVAAGANFVAKRQISKASDIPSKPVSGNGNLGSFKHPDNNNDGLASARPSKPVGLDFNRMVHMDNNMTPRQDLQGLSDPVQMMKMLAENSQHQQNNPNGFRFGFGSKNNDSNNVALTAAQAWMSLGGATTGGVTKPLLLENRNPQKQQISADSLYNPTRDRHQPQVTRFRGEFNSYQQPVRPLNNGQLQNRNVGFPQMVTATDLSQFQVQSGWRGAPPQMQEQSRPKQESRPPDLNIGYQSIGSPVRQSPGMLVDSQQPDLALQL